MLRYLIYDDISKVNVVEDRYPILVIPTSNLETEKQLRKNRRVLKMFTLGVYRLEEFRRTEENTVRAKRVEIINNYTAFSLKLGK